MLTNTQLEEYKSKGFCVAHRLVTEAASTRWLDEIEPICAGAALAHHDPTRIEMEPNQSADGTKVRRVYDPCIHYDVFHNRAGGSKMVDRMVRLFGPDVLFFPSKINVKSAEIGSAVDWHQDMAYSPPTNRSVVTVLIYLDHADVGNGCLQAVPGEHRMLDHSLNGFFQGRTTEHLDTSKAVPIAGKRGTTIFFSGLVPHASSVNISSRPRRTLSLGYRAADAFPIHLGHMTGKADQFVRVVHGKQSTTARFDMESVFIPRYPAETKSLFERQERSKAQSLDSSLSVVIDANASEPGTGSAPES
jgi:phytanoyl-CoA hydroxylase